MKKISHKGHVDRIEGHDVFVKIVSTSACASCKAKSMCQLSESKDKEVKAYTVYPEKYKIGDEVTVSLQQDLGLKAVFWAYFMPFVVLVAGLFLFYYLLNNELYASLIAIGLTTLYYLSLKYFSRFIEQKFVFVLE